MSAPTHPMRLWFGIAAGTVAISSASIFIRLALLQGMPALTIATWRMVFACLFLCPWAWVTHRDEIKSVTPRERGLLVASGICLALHFAAWIASLAYLSVARSVVLVCMGPIFVALGSWLFLGERPSRPTWLGILLAAVGTAVVSQEHLAPGQQHPLGYLLALTGALCAAAYLMIGRRVRKHRSLMAYIAMVYGLAMITLLAVVLATRQTLLGFPAAAYGWCLLLGLIPQLIGHSTLNFALRHLSATSVSLITLAEPIGATLLAFLLFQENITLQVAVGGLFILVGITLANRLKS